MNQFELSVQELLIIEFALINRLEFLKIKQDSYKLQPQMFEYFSNAEVEVKNLAKKLNIEL
jgi:hypothetical protein